MDLNTIRTAISELDRAFVADMQALPPATWQQPSDCAGWTIAAALIHLAQVAELLGGSLARGRAGDPGPPPLAAAEGIAAWRAVRAERQKEALTQTPAELMAWYAEATAALNVELDAIPGASPEATGWHPVGAQPLPWIQDQWLFELALHDWDIRVALDPDAEIRKETQAAFAYTLPARLGRGFKGADDPALAGTYRIEVTSSDPLTASVVVGGGAVAVSEGANSDTPTATIVTDPTAFGLVVTNRRPVDGFSASGRWRISGDAARAEKFSRAYSSY
ncbi:MAG: maleylpyruvate isomerase N-terminal domain-containing protein [Chloroflexota bacterium]